MELTEVLKQVYKNKSAVKMTTVEAIRELFADKGYDILFDYSSLKKYLWDLAPAEQVYRSRFALMYDCGAAECVKRATLDVYNYAEHFKAAEEKLIEVGLNKGVAHETVYILYEALGFPSETALNDPQTVKEDGDEGWIYVGEVKNGKPHGRGCEELIYDGVVYDRKEGLWINGEVYGYHFSKEDLGASTYCFYVNGLSKGKTTEVWPNGEIFTDEF